MGGGATHDASVPEDVRRFVLTRVPSVPWLEALLLLRASTAPLRVRTLAERLYMAEERVTDLVHALADARLVAPAGPHDPAWRFAPASPDLARMIDRLADCYAHNLLEVTRLIHSNTERKAQQFADAFKLRKDP